MKWSGGVISIGSAAVNFFFVISGFLIVRSFKHSSGFWDYIKKRILRIYPGFIVAFILCFVVFGPIGYMKEISFDAYLEFFKTFSFKREIANMLSLQSPIENNYFTTSPQSGLNNSLWTIQFEFICYLLTPLLVWFTLKKHKSWALIALFAAYILYYLQSVGYIFQFSQKLNGHIIGNPYYYPRFFTYFLCGSCVYLYRNHIPRNEIVAFIALALFVLSFKFRLINELWPITGTYLTFYFAFHKKLRFPNFAKYGDFSYGIYLYGWPLQQLVMLYLWQKMNPLSFFAIVFPIVLFISILSWRYIEKPALKMKRGNIGK